MRYYRFGLDYLRFNFPAEKEYPFLDSLFYGLSSNSNEKFNVNVFGIECELKYLEFRNKQVIMVSYYGDVVFEVARILDAGAARALSFTWSFYGAFFYIKEIYYVLFDFLNRYGDDIQVSRCDIALDVPISVDSLYDRHATSFKKEKLYKSSGVLESFYLGAKANNPKHFIRVYDKRLDSMKKGKFHLHYQYLAEAVVTRIELQMNVQSCKVFGVTSSFLYESIKQSEDDTILWGIFNACCRNNDGTNFFDLSTIKNLQKVEPAKAQKTTLVMDEIPYARVMLGYARRLHGLGFDVLGYLSSRLDEVVA